MRITPQFYTHSPTVISIIQSIAAGGPAASFLGRVFFTLLPDRDGRATDIIPVQSITDHISGNLFVLTINIP